MKLQLFIKSLSADSAVENKPGLGSESGHHELMQILFSKWLFIASCLIVTGCHAEMSHSKNNVSGKAYFATFSGYSIPLKLVDEITESDALSRDAYYVATYENGVLLGVEKYFRGRLFFKHEYFNHENGALKESRTVNEDGEKNVLLFDERGKMIKKD